MAISVFRFIIVFGNPNNERDRPGPTILNIVSTYCVIRDLEEGEVSFPLASSFIFNLHGKHFHVAHLHISPRGEK